jgi:exo-1,4-beta-D-glucosaminidase
MPAERMETEVRYLAEANLTTVTFEDLPVPCDAFLEACDRYGLMYWTSFYSSYWVRPGANVPTDQRLLADCAVDVIKRYWNHPSVVLYSCVGEGVPAKDIYLTWRKNVLALDRTRHFIPTIDVRFPMDWLKEDVPTGLHDAVAFDWIDPAGYYQKVRAGGKWMYNTEVSIASLPPVSSLRKFVPNLLKETRAKPAPFSVDATWAHHDATLYMKDYDPAIRRLYGPPRSAEDYCWKAHLVTATQHRAWSEAANHRMWEITSGIWQWKLNSCWPSVGWQIYDWYLKPMVSYYSYKSAFEPLHVQLSPLDSMVTVVNRRLGAETDLKVRARVFDSRMVLKWEKQATTGVEANAYQDVFTVPKISGLSPVYFARLDLTDGGGKLLSENFYWLSSRQPADYTALEHLPTVRLKVSPEIETRGGQTIAHVRLENPSAHLAFFVQLAITKGSQGDEVLPVFWDENYFSLLPKEAKQVDATFATAALSGTTPVVEVGGWNVQTSFDCTDLKLSKTEVPANETVSVAATIKNTFLDGSRIELCVDNEAVDSTFLWARGDSGRRAAFELKLRQPGSHEIKVGNRRAVLLVK